MTKQNHKTGILVTVMICCAILFRVLGNLGICMVPLGILRSLIYISLYIGWGISVRRRIIQPQVRFYMIGISLLTVCWFLLRTLKYLFVTDPDIIRHLWYGYYFPMLFIPFFALFISMVLGKPENYRLSKRAKLLYIPALLCLLLVLTNDLHQLVFTFPAGALWSDKNNGYAIGYYFVFGWIIFCALAAFGIMLLKCRLAQRKKYLPALLLAVSVVYALIYVSGAQWMRIIGGDITAAQCLLFVGILESCIACGLIQSNTGYEDLFMVSRLSAQITNQEHAVCLASANARALTREQRMRAQSQPVLLDKNTIIKSEPIRFGHVLWQEDVSELTEAIRQIEENCENLAERNRIRQENLETQKKILALQEKNRANDLLHRETARQIDLIDQWLSQYDTEQDDRKRRMLLAGVAVVGAYIKRYGNLLLVNEHTKTMDICDLSRCFEESFRNLKLMDVNCLCTLPSDIMLTSKDILHIYHTFEAALEDCMYDLHDIWVNAREIPGQILLSIEFVCDRDLSHHGSKADLFSTDEGTSRFTFRLQRGGDGK